jgi:hypothetical protein
MKKLFFTLLLLCFSISLQAHAIPDAIPPYSESNAVTYSFSGGRLGDNLLAYFHAKWIAYKYDLPFVYIPFEFSDRFVLHEGDIPRYAFSYKHRTRMKKEEEAMIPHNSTLITVPYFPETPYEYERAEDLEAPFFIVDWDDPLFKQEVVRCLTLLNPIATPDLPEGVITVGVHVRRGGSFEDYNHARKKFPLKFPSDDYYLEQIEMIANLFKGRPLFVQILTDHLNPQSIVEEYTRVLNNPNLTICYRQSEGSYEETLLEDFFTIPKFDCLVVGQSNFSIIASKLGNYAVIVSPTHASGKQHQIDQVELKLNEEHLLFAEVPLDETYQCP